MAGNAKALPLENRKPLLDLIQPRAMDRGDMEDKARRTLQPSPDFFAVMCRDIVADHVDRRNRRGISASSNVRKAINSRWRFRL